MNRHCINIAAIAALAVLCGCASTSDLANVQTRVARLEAQQGAEPFRQSMYLVVHTKLNWTEAKTAAERLGGHLAVISNEEENAFVADLLKRRGTGGHAWIGVRRGADRKTWVTVTGEECEFFAWGQGEPGNSHGNQDCAAAGADGLWDDQHGTGTWTRPFVVEFATVTE